MSSLNLLASIFITSYTAVSIIATLLALAVLAAVARLTFKRERNRSFEHTNCVVSLKEGRAYARSGEQRRALRAFRRALRHAHAAGDIKLAVESLHELGSLHYQRVRFNRAYRCFKRASALASDHLVQAEDSDSTGAAAGVGVGVGVGSSDSLSALLKSVHQGLEYSSWHAKAGCAMRYGSQASMFARIGNWSVADGYFCLAVSLAEKRLGGDSLLVAYLLKEQAEVRQKAQRSEGARHLLWRANRIISEWPDLGADIASSIGENLDSGHLPFRGLESDTREDPQADDLS